MAGYNNKKPLIKQGWLRALLFTCFYFILLVLAGFVLALSIDKTNPALTADRLFYIQFLVNALVSFTAISARILRSSSRPDFFRPEIRRE